jgi:hypothetical protein
MLRRADLGNTLRALSETGKTSAFSVLFSVPALAPCLLHEWRRSGEPMKMWIWFWQTLLVTTAVLSARIVIQGLAPALVTTALERTDAFRVRRRSPR